MRRSPARVMLLVVLAGLVVSGATLDRTRPVPAAAAGTADAGVPGAATRSAAWFCAAGSSAANGPADETIVITNAGPSATQTQVTVMPGARLAAVSRPFTVGARSQRIVRVADIVAAVDPGVMVESYGGDVAVEHILSGSRDFSITPCARRAARRWQFAAGSTARDVREVIAVFNPFADDAVIEMVFATDEGVKRPPALRAVVVPGRSRISITVGDVVARQEHVAADLIVHRGRVVAERTMAFDGSAGRSGLTTALGARTQDHVAFAEGVVVDGITENLVLFNPADRDAAASVRVHLDNDQVLEPQDVAVPARSTVVVDLGVRVPKTVGHAIEVTTTEGQIVAERVVYARAPAPRTGVEATTGIPAPANRWLFAFGQADATQDEWLSVWNPGTRPVTFTVAVLAAGQLLVPQGLEAIVVAPGKRRVLRLGDALQRHDTPLTVSANRPVYVERGVYSAGFSLSPGVVYGA